MRRVQVVVLTVLAFVPLLLFVPAVKDCLANALPRGLPSWFQDLDTDGDEQVALPELLAGGRGDFQKHDRNQDGLLTPEEAVRAEQDGSRLELVNGRASCSGDVEVSAVGPYRGRRAYRAFSIQLQSGKVYQFEQVSPGYFAYLILEGPKGELLSQHDSGGNGRTARIIHKAVRTGTYRIIATSQGGLRTGPCKLSVRTLMRAPLRGLPSWFQDLDTDGDGQVSLAEWLAGEQALGEFLKHDANQDGLLTPVEAARGAGGGPQLEWVGGLASVSGDIEPSPPEPYRGRRAYRAYSIRLERGKRYRIEQVSPAYSAHVFLEGPGGKLLAQHDSGGAGRTARIVYRAARSGIYRVVATGQGRYRSGAFKLSVRALAGLDTSLPPGPPEWLQGLDTDGDDQVSLAEWLAQDGQRDDFELLDLNQDGFISAEEAARIR